MLFGLEDIYSFEPGSVPVRDAAIIYGKDPAWIRQGLRNGYLNIGFATKTEDGKRYNYYISPKKLYEETGVIWKPGMFQRGKTL